MRVTLIASLILAAAAIPSAVSAQKSAQLASAAIDNNSAQTVSDSKPAAAAPAEKKICRNLPSSYSRRTERVCMTKEEWSKVEADAQ